MTDLICLLVIGTRVEDATGQREGLEGRQICQDATLNALPR